MKQHYLFFVLFFFFACSQESREVVSKLPKPGQGQKKMVFVLSDQKNACLETLLPNTEVFNSMQSEWTLERLSLKPEELENTMREIIARNPRVVLLTTALHEALPGLRVPKRDETIVEAFSFDAASGVSVSWTELLSLYSKFCDSRADLGICQSFDKNCPTKSAEGKESFVSTSRSLAPLLHMRISWQEVFGRMDSRLHPLRVNIASGLLEYEPNKLHPNFQDFQPIFKSWVMENL